MRCLGLGCAAGLLLAACGTSASRAPLPTLGWPPPSTRTVFNLGQGLVRPISIFNNNLSTGAAVKILWTSWGGAEARGHGRGWFVPHGARNGEGYNLPAVVVAFRLGTCGGHPAYKAVEWYFPGRHQHFDPDISGIPLRGMTTVCGGHSGSS